MDPTFSHMNSVHILRPYFLNIHFNIDISFNLSLVLQNISLLVHFLNANCVLYVPAISYSSWPFYVLRYRTLTEQEMLLWNQKARKSYDENSHYIHLQCFYLFYFRIYVSSIVNIRVKLDLRLSQWWLWRIPLCWVVTLFPLCLITHNAILIFGEVKVWFHAS
jgi:hypothetical protein